MLLFRNKKNLPIAIAYFIELIIVFAGVYLAYLLGQSQQMKTVEKEQLKVMKALKFELEEFRVLMPLQAGYMERQLDKWNKAVENDSIAAFYTWRFLEPQHNYHILEYALNQEGTDIISFELYDELSKTYAVIKRLEQAERRLTLFSDKFNNIPRNLEKSTDSYAILVAENRLNFFKFRQAARDRLSNMKLLSENAKNILGILNQTFTIQQRKEIEKKMIISFLRTADNDDLEDAKLQVLEHFALFDEPEIQQMVEEIMKERKNK